MSRKGIPMLFFGLIVICFSIQIVAAQINGTIFPEYYMIAKHHEGVNGIQGQHGFWIRLLYIGFNTGLGQGWSATVGFEMNSPSFEKETMVPYVKNAFISKKLTKGSQLLIGIVPPPSFDKIEDFWGLRYIEKTSVDFFQLAASRDFGIALKGKTGNGLVYTLMYGNYGSIEGEWNKGKAIYGRIGWETESLYLETNGHIAKDDQNKTGFLSLFGGIKGTWGRSGLGYHYKYQKAGESDRENNGIVSAFAVVNAGKKIQVFARYDHHTDLNFNNISGYLPIPAAEFKSRFLMIGMAYKISRLIQVSPNIKYVFYGDPGGGGQPGGDWYFNLTGNIVFKTGLGRKD